MAKHLDAAARERARRLRAQQASDEASPVALAEHGLDAGDTRRAAASVCAWCAGPIELKRRGRIPKWCSPACRQRAWAQMLRELAQQLDSGRIYRRDLPDLHAALTDVLAAYNRMTTAQARPHR